MINEEYLSRFKKLSGVLNESITDHKSNIIQFVKNNSYFDYDGEENGILEFSTRQNGSVSNETASKKDLLEGEKLKSKILEIFKNIDVNLEVVDEWVLISISDKKEQTDQFRYAFIKDSRGLGFTEYYDTMDDLIKKRGNWIDVDWNLIKNKIEDINDFPNNHFTGWHGSKKILIKKIEKDGNKSEVKYYIQKDKNMDD